METRRRPLGLVRPTLILLACLIGTAIAGGAAALVGMSHYLGHQLAYLGLGTYRGLLSDDTFVGPALSLLGTPDVHLAQTQAAALTAVEFCAIFLAARLAYRGLRHAGDPPDRPRFQLSPRLLGLFVIAVVVAAGLLALDYNLYIYRALIDALVEHLKGKYVAGSLPRWELLNQQHGDLYSINALRLFAAGSLFVTVASAVVLEFAITRTFESSVALVDEIEGRSEVAEPAPQSDLDYDELRPVIGSDPEEQISIAEALKEPERLTVDEAGNVYAHALYERLALVDAQPAEHTNGGTR